jgi:CRISPR system Cascade subunit CasE
MNLFLSRLLLDQRSRQVMSELAHSYEMHRTLMRAFGSPSDDKERKQRDEFCVLYRADIDVPGIVKVYVQSCVEPNWSYLEELPDYLYWDQETPGYEYKDVTSPYLNIREGDRFNFRLRANPVKRVGKNNDEMIGKRVGLVREDEQIDWLERRAKACGFELLANRVEDDDGGTKLIPRVTIRPEGKHTSRKKDGEKKHTMTHLAVLFDGYLRVTEAKVFMDTVAHGIGPAKAFGCGLLSLARA